MIAKITNYALAALLLVVAWQGYRIKIVKADRTRLEIQLEIAHSSNTDNISTIHKLEKANNQCASDRAANSKAAETNLEYHQKRVVSIGNAYDQIKQDYEKLKGVQVGTRCAVMRIDDDIIERLQAAHNLQNTDG